MATDPEATRPTGERGGVPPFVVPYLAYFRELHASLLLHEGFVLVPVEVPSMEIGRALCTWLEQEGARVRVILPEPGQWRALGPSLSSQSMDATDFVAVLGPRETTEEVAAGLNLLNLQRDTLAAHLGRPMIWCGLRSFLNATWREAPDFWSIRDITLRIPVLTTSDTSHVPGGGPWMEPTPEPETIAELVEDARRVKDDRNLARLLLGLARSLLARGRPDEAERPFEEADALITSLSSFRGTHEDALLEETRGDLAWPMRGVEAAEEAYGRAFAAYDVLGDGLGRARLLGKLGRCAFYRRELDAAAEMYERALAEVSRLGDLATTAQLLLLRGRVRFYRTDYDAAMRDYEEAASLFVSMQDRLGEAEVRKAIGEVRLRWGDLAGASKDYDAALALYEERKDALGRATVLLGRAHVRFQRGDIEGAAADCAEALALFRAVNDRQGEAYIRQMQGKLRRGRGDLDGAAAELDEALALFERIQQRYGQAGVWKDRGDLDVAREKPDAALVAYAEALGIYESIADLRGASSVLARMAEAHLRLGQRADARALAERCIPLAERSQNEYAIRIATSVLKATASPT